MTEISCIFYSEDVLWHDLQVQTNSINSNNFYITNVEEKKNLNVSNSWKSGK